MEGPLLGGIEENEVVYSQQLEECPGREMRGLVLSRETP